ncbi:transcription-repair coupling factor [bacterium]|nr:transcription-repair coupling factor [bacterium]
MNSAYSNVTLAQAAYYSAARQRKNQARSILVIVPDTDQAEKLFSDLEFFSGSEAARRPLLFPAWDALPFDEVSPSIDVSATRLATTNAIAQGSSIVIAPIAALVQKVISPSVIEAQSLRLDAESEYSLEKLIAGLDALGYQRASLVEEVGQYAARGMVVDFFPLNLKTGTNLPIRVQFFADLIERISSFDAESQRTVEKLSSVEILPVKEFLIWPTQSEENLNSEQQLSAGLERIRKRGLELEVPRSKIEEVTTAIANQETYAGLEHLQGLIAESSLVPLLSIFPRDTEVIIYDRRSVEKVAQDFSEIVNERYQKAVATLRLVASVEAHYLAVQEVLSELLQRTDLELESLSLVTSTTDASEVADRIGRRNTLIQAASTKAKHQERPLEGLVQEIKRLGNSGFRIALISPSTVRMQRLKHLFAEYNLPIEEFTGSFPAWLASSAPLSILEGYLSEGFTSTADRLQIISEAEIFPQLRGRRAGKLTAKRASSVKKILGSLAQLQVDDFVVHEDHGIGLYRGLREIVVEGKIGDFLFLEYAEEARLFVPVEQIARIEKYIGAEGSKPVLNRLGGRVWEKQKKQVQEKVTVLAGKLINLYAARSVAQGISLGTPTTEDEAFAETFPYAETPDQLNAITAVLEDLGRTQPMDRLVCGDVGFGKTEVALRAAFRSVQAGKQVAVLVPTTILAEQHQRTFSERFADFAYNVESLSRFQGAEKNKQTLAALAEGKVDIVIGTHRLLQKDVEFKDLGLVIIDEEHRFGVQHKEKLKSLRQEVHILTLTATPIPRTLHMSLLGLRDLSVIETAPHDRQVIQTFLMPYSATVLREALLRELGRSGQAFIIHNRVADIQAVAQEISGFVPEAKIAFAHGQMPERELEAIMHRFVQGEIDVLVSTTIVESGLDIPNANTIIILESDKFGLAELYQLRGRVGRSTRRAFAYLFISDSTSLSKDAKKRLDVLQSLDDLGVGFRLALQDMEIRGAGNLLGKDQSGSVELVGFELYTKILAEAIDHLRTGQTTDEDQQAALTIDPEIKVGFPAHIPADYIPDVGERLSLYQRLAACKSEAEAAEYLFEIEDRFGRVPVEVVGLIELMAFRAILQQAGITTARGTGHSLTIYFHERAAVNREKLIQVAQQSPSYLKLSPQGSITLQLDQEIQSVQDYSKALKEFLAVGIMQKDCN